MKKDLTRCRHRATWYNKVTTTGTCGEFAVARGLCAKHYQQERRGMLGEAPKRAANGEGDQITFRCSTPEKIAATNAAAKAKMELSEYVREAVRKMMGWKGL